MKWTVEKYNKAKPDGTAAWGIKIANGTWLIIDVLRSEAMRVVAAHNNETQSV